jgi:hypothetical protein
MGFKSDTPSTGKTEPARNDAEREAKNDYNWEKNNTGNDPVPTSPPDWAKDIPSPDK